MSNAVNPTPSGMPGTKVIKIRLALKGRPVKSYSFNKDVIAVGRNPDSDIALDNPGISRNHLRIVQTPGGYYEVEDLGSANGTFVNDVQVQREYLMNNDVIRVGKFTMWVNYEADRRESPTDVPHHGTPNAYAGTTILSMSDIERMMAKEKESSSELRVVQSAPPSGSWVSREVLGVVALIALVSGLVIGAGAVWIIIR